MQASILLVVIASPILKVLVSAESVQCPGVLHVDGPSSTGCSVGGTLQSVLLSSCAGWPICMGPVTISQKMTPLSCATDIPLTANNYDSLVASASSSLKESGTNYQTTLAPGTIRGASTPTITASPASISTGSDSPYASSTGVSMNGGALLAGPAAAIGSGFLAFLGML